MSSKTFNSINSGVQQVLTQPSPSDGGSLAHLATVYAGIKPLLTALVASPFFPPKWRAAVTGFVAALAAFTGGARADLKAGRGPLGGSRQPPIPPPAPLSPQTGRRGRAPW